MVAAQVFRLKTQCYKPSAISMIRYDKLLLTVCRLWRLATVPRLMEGFFSPLAVLCSSRILPSPSNVLFMRMFSCTYFSGCLASHSQRVRAVEWAGIPFLETRQ